MNRRMFLGTAIAASMCAALPSAGIGAGPRPVQVGVVTTAIPYSYVKDGKYIGLSNEILQEVAKLQNLTLDYQPMKFDALIPALQAGQIAIAVSGIFVTEARKQVVDFSNPYHTQGAIIVVPVDSPIKSLAELKGKTVATQQGSAALATAKKHADEWGVQLRILQDAANMQLAMKTGDVAAMIYDSGILAYQMKVEKDKPTIRTISDVLDPTGIAFAFQKGSDLPAIISEGMKKMEENGELARIKQRYELN